MTALQNRAHEERPWGAFDRFTLNELSTVKIITLKPNEELSLQRHQKRAEFWRIISGTGTVTVDNDITPAAAGDEFYIDSGLAHRATSGNDGLVFLEISLGTFEEHDEERLEDKYGRGSPTP